MSKHILFLLVFGLVIGFSVPAYSQDYVEGKQYQVVPQPVPTSSGDKIEVLEVFWYGCPHCYRLEPYVNRWLQNKPDNVEFVRQPGMLSPRWMLHARAFYTAEILGVEDQIHDSIFDDIHGARKRLNTADAIMAKFKEIGVPEDKFKQVFLSFAVETKLRQADQLQHLYNIDGVPAVIVNGKYSTGPRQAGGYNKVFDVVNYLIGLENKQ